MVACTACRRPTARRDHLVPLKPQRPPHEVAYPAVVVHHQNAHRLAYFPSCYGSYFYRQSRAAARAESSLAAVLMER